LDGFNRSMTGLAFNHYTQHLYVCGRSPTIICINQLL
jgi:hypothetical protein